MAGEKRHYSERGDCDDHHSCLPPSKSSGRALDNSKAALRHEEGYTLVELLVATGLLLLIAGLTYGVYLFAVKEVVSWRRGLALENSFHLISRQISEDFFQTDSLIAWADEEFVLRLRSGDSVRYVSKNRSLTRNHHPMHGRELFVSSLELAVPESHQVWSSVLEVVQAAPGPFLTVSIAITDGHRVLHDTVAVGLRGPSMWSLLAAPDNPAR